jgi:hypothetical protein
MIGVDLTGFAIGSRGLELLYFKYQCKAGESQTMFGFLGIKLAISFNGNLFDNGKTAKTNLNCCRPR